MTDPRRLKGDVFNVGGGNEISTSLKELTKMCQETVGNSVAVNCNPETTSVDIPLYVSDSSKVRRAFGWQPKRSVKEIVEGITDWLRHNEQRLKPIFL